MAEPVLLISSDPFLGASLEAVTHGRLHVARVDPSHPPTVWPAGPVVLDVASRHRLALHAWIRHHHPGLVVVVLKPGEHQPALPPDPNLQVVARPFRVESLVALLGNEPTPTLGKGRVGREETAREAGGGGEREPERGWEQYGERKQEQTSADPVRLPHPAGPARQPNPPHGGPPLGRVADWWKRFARLSTPPAPGATLLTPLAPAPDAPDLNAPTPTPGAAALDPLVPTPRSRTRSGAMTGLDPGRGWARRPELRAWRVVTRTLIALLVALVLAGGWLAFGLLEARQDLVVGAAGVRAELARAEAALERGQPGAAGAAMQAAHRSLEAAVIVSERRELRAAARLPVLSGGLADTRRLLAAAATMTGAGDRAVALAARLGPGRMALLRDGRFDLDALEDATVQARGMVAELDRVREELDRVRGGPFAPGVAETRRWALDRLEVAGARARLLVATLEPLPAALGADGPRRYLVVLTGPAEPGPAGGGPLAAREVVVDGGVVRTSPVRREVVEALGATGAIVPFPAVGQAMAEAAEALGQPRPDGVIALDPMAVRTLLEVTRPVAVPGHGRLDAAGAVRQLTGEAHGRHQATLAAVVTRLLDGRDLLATARVVGAAGARHNLQIYADDPALQRMLALRRLTGP